MDNLLRLLDRLNITLSILTKLAETLGIYTDTDDETSQLQKCTIETIETICSHITKISDFIGKASIGLRLNSDD